MSEPLGLPYHRIHRGGLWGPHGWWRGIVGVVALLVVALVVQAALIFTWAGVEGYDLSTEETPATPGFLLMLNLGWALAIPLTWGAMKLHDLPPGWVSSVVPRIRWKWFATCLGLALVALFATLVVATLVPADGGTEMSGSLNDFTDRTRDFLLVILFLTPLQAAGEEYVFRGYITQGVGGLFENPRVSLAVAVIVPATLFALAHGLGQEPPIFVDRLAFGLVAGVLTIATGGLEAGIAMHVLNNFLAYGVALAFDDMESALNPTGSTWWTLPTTLTQSLVYLILAVWMSRRLGLQTRTAAGVLAGPAARV